MNRHSGLLVAALAILATSCYASTEAIQRLIPADARSIDKRDIGGGKQVSYSVDREYPASGIQTDGLDTLRKGGWVYCNKKGEAEWSSFLDAGGGSRERVYQRLSYLKKDDRLITIGERYYASAASQVRPGGKSRPDDKNQQVIIVEGKVGAKQISELLESSRATCEGTSK